MRRLAYIIGAIVGLATFAVLTIYLAMPRLNWSAAVKPGGLEARIADAVRERWIKLHSPDQKNPFAPTPENLADGRNEYSAHCAMCHALDGSGRRGLDASFYPPVAALTGDTQQMSDAEIYFVIANGVALSGMPSFGKQHSSQEIWKSVLWVRHLPNLSPGERKKIDQETSDKERHHEEVMRQASSRHDSGASTDVGIGTILALRRAPARNWQRVEH